MSHSYLLLRDIIKSMFGEINDRKETQVQVNCPRCAKLSGEYESDGKFNLEINFIKKVYKCWKCEISGSIPKLIKYFGNNELLELYTDNYDLYDYSGMFGPSEELEEVTPQLPKEFRSFTDIDLQNEPYYWDGYNYLVLERGMSKDMIRKYNIGMCKDGKYKDSIIFPSYDKFGNVNYYVQKPLKRKIPYINCSFSKNIIINEHLIDWNNTVYITEGFFDSYSIPMNNNLILLGKKMSHAVFTKIKKYKPPLVILLDPDAFGNVIKMIELLYNNNLDEDKILYAKFPENMDIDEYKKIHGAENLVKFLVTNTKKLTENDSIKYKIYEI